MIVSTSVLSLAQIGGNQVYTNSHSSNNPYHYSSPKGGGGNVSSMQSTDRLLTITSSVLLHEVADRYLLTVGLNQEAETVLACNTAINKRIAQVLNALKKLGIKAEDTYVDFVTQTKVYDYEVGQTEAQQLERGFEIKKNINIHFEDILLMDQIVEICASQEIYDIINIEYLIDDINVIYERLFEEAMVVAEARKKTFEKFGSRSVSSKYRVVSDNFFSVFPKTQYKQYEAKESSDLNIYQSNNRYTSYVRKEARKNRTFYYEGLFTGNFDKVIGMQNPQIGVQHALTLTIEYQLQVD